MSKRENIAADIPTSLRYADELLNAYGRWAADRPTARRCGSAEGNYRPGGGEVLEGRRESKQWSLRHDEAMLCQRALARVPDRERIVLSILYIPRRVPPEMQLRLLRIPPRLARERHLIGLRMFDNTRLLLQMQVRRTKPVDNLGMLGATLPPPVAGTEHRGAGMAAPGVSETGQKASQDAGLSRSWAIG